jgi:hypothetical protein
MMEETQSEPLYTQAQQSSIPTMPYTNGQEMQGAGQGMNPNLMTLMKWLQELMRSGTPLPPVAAHLMNLHGFEKPQSPPTYNPDSTVNEKYTSYNY